MQRRVDDKQINDARLVSGLCGLRFVRSKPPSSQRGPHGNTARSADIDHCGVSVRPGPCIPPTFASPAFLTYLLSYPFSLTHSHYDQPMKRCQYWLDRCRSNSHCPKLGRRRTLSAYFGGIQPAPQPQPQLDRVNMVTAHASGNDDAYMTCTTDDQEWVRLRRCGDCPRRLPHWLSEAYGSFVRRMPRADTPTPGAGAVYEPTKPCWRCLALRTRGLRLRRRPTR